MNTQENDGLLKNVQCTCTVHVKAAGWFSYFLFLHIVLFVIDCTQVVTTLHENIQGYFVLGTFPRSGIVPNSFFL